MTLELLMQDKYKNGLEQGLAKGLAQGKAQAKTQIVKNLYSKNIPLETIAECTNLCIEEVNKILSER